MSLNCCRHFSNAANIRLNIIHNLFAKYHEICDLKPTQLYDCENLKHIDIFLYSFLWT